MLLAASGPAVRLGAGLRSPPASSCCPRLARSGLAAAILALVALFRGAGVLRARCRPRRGNPRWRSCPLPVTWLPARCRRSTTSAPIRRSRALRSARRVPGHPAACGCRWRRTSHSSARRARSKKRAGRSCARIRWAGRIEAVATTFWSGFKDDVVIRIAADGPGSRVDVRSKSRVGKGDLGTNAQRIRAYQRRLQ